MTAPHDLSADGRILTIRVPFSVQHRGGRKLAGLPEGGGTWAPSKARTDSTLIKALARAFRWQRMLESGQFGSLAELAKAEKINQSYLCRVLRLTLLAPEIVEAILDGRQPAAWQLELLLKPFPCEWSAQRKALATENKTETLC